MLFLKEMFLCNSCDKINKKGLQVFLDSSLRFFHVNDNLHKPQRGVSYLLKDKNAMHFVLYQKTSGAP